MKKILLVGLVLGLIGCGFSPETPCSWTTSNGSPLCECNGSVGAQDIKAACCAAVDAPSALCGDAGP